MRTFLLAAALATTLPALAQESYSLDPSHVIVIVKVA